MKYPSIVKPIAASLLSLMVGSVAADGFKVIKTRIKIEACRDAVAQRKPGTVVKLEYKVERGTPTYEFEVAGSDGARWELECDGFSGKITEVEREVAGPDDPLFRARMTISLDEARRIALKVHPGTLVETEYEIEENGDTSYEFDIRTADGRELKLEVDAASGRVVEDDEEEFYQIGTE